MIGFSAQAETFNLHLPSPLYAGQRGKTQFIDINKILTQQKIDLKNRAVIKIEIWGYTGKGGASILLSTRDKLVAGTRFVKSSSSFENGSSKKGDWGYSVLKTEPVPWPFVRLWTQGEVWVYALRITCTDIELKKLN